ncbi:T9SS type A sorting domain-containing protein [Dyadobacter sp. 676]|uniref:T9SS type A sorting domain-containing protein n=1 Tax=Dyadobacter sp. 676 TaxID=3088362 RepID=A0AAU8FFT5_9BACT
MKNYYLTARYWLLAAVLLFNVLLFSFSTAWAQCELIQNGSFTGTAGWTGVDPGNITLTGWHNADGINVRSIHDGGVADFSQNLTNVPTSGAVLTFRFYFDNGGDGVTRYAQSNLTISYAGTTYFSAVTDPQGASGPATFSGANGAMVSPLSTPEDVWTTVTINLPSGIPESGDLVMSMSNSNGVVSDDISLDDFSITRTTTAGSITGDQTICNGGTPAALTNVTEGTGAQITYRWQQSVSPFTTWTDIAGATDASYTPTSGLTETTQYRRITVANNGGAVCDESAPTAVVTVTVQSTPTSGDIVGDQTVCTGAAPAEITSGTSGTGSGTISYQWESSVAPFTDWTPIAGATGANYTPPAGLTATTRYRRLSVSTLNSVQCTSSPTAFVTVTVNPLPTISGQSTACVDGSLTLTGSGTPAASTPWTSSDSGIATVSDLGVVTGMAPGSATITYTDQNGCSATFAVTIEAKPVAVQLNATQTTPTCPDTTFNLESLVTGTAPAGSVLQFYTDSVPTPATLVADPTAAPAGKYYAFYVNATCTSPASPEITVNPCAMPVTLITFALQREGNVSKLEWATTEETGSDRFEIERSADGKNWSKIGQIPSHKESRELRRYSFVDDRPLAGSNYYRLRMVDLDETFAYSSVLHGEFEKTAVGGIYPNPVRDRLFIKDVEPQTIKEVSIWSAAGTQVLKFKRQAVDGIDVSKLGSGIYMVRIEQTNGTLSTQKVIISR